MISESAPDTPMSFLDLHDGRRIAIRYRVAANQPTILFLPGYASDMAGQKALSIDRFCASRGLGCLRLDYSGTGASAGEFAEGTLDRWLDEVLAAIDFGVPEGRLILAGSSMGGWLALHAALRRPGRVAALLGIAAAPDFTEWGYSESDKEALARHGKLERVNPYGPEASVTYRAFWQSGAAHRLLDSAIDLPIPVRLVHGTEDQEVPLAVPLRLVEQLQSPNVQLRLIKGAGHRLSEPQELHAILAELRDLVETVDLSSPGTTSGMGPASKDPT